MKVFIPTFLVACLLAACSPARSAGPVDSPPPVATPGAGDIVLTDAVGQPVDPPRTVTVTVGQTVFVALTMRYDTSRGVFLSSWTPGAASPLPSTGQEVNIPPLAALGGDRFQAAATGRAVLAAQAANGGAAALVWRVEVVILP